MNLKSTLVMLRDGVLKVAVVAVLVLMGLTACENTTTKSDAVTPGPGTPPEPWRSVLNLDPTKVFNDVTWSESLSRYVAVGELRGVGGVIMYSDDGNSWTEAATSLDISQSLFGVTRSESLERFVAVGGNGIILFSSNGMSWSEATSGTNNRLRSVTWSESLELFIAVSTSGIVLNSDDGMSWDRARYLDGSLYDVSWSESLSRFVAVGSDRKTIVDERDDPFYDEVIDTRLPVIFYSDNGWSWRTASIRGDMYDDLYSVTWSERLERFVAVGDIVAHSADGISWSTSESAEASIRDAVGYFFLRSIVWSETHARFLAVGGEDIVHSEDGTNWTAAYFDGAVLYAVTGSETAAGFVAVGDDSVAYSEDGSVWREAQSTGGDIPAAYFQDVARSESVGKYVAVGDYRTIVHSEDGSTWSASSIENPGPSMYAGITGVAWGESAGRFVAVGWNGLIWHSTDGVTWSEVSSFMDYNKDCGMSSGAIPSIGSLLSGMTTRSVPL